MVSEVEGGFRTKLVYSYENFHSKSPLFLIIGNFNPIAIYGSAMHSAAIDMNGSIIFIPDSIRKNPYELIEPLFLPNKEKSVCLAFNFYDIYAVSSKGKLFSAKIKNSSKFNF